MLKINIPAVENWIKGKLTNTWEIQRFLSLSNEERKDESEKYGITYYKRIFDSIPKLTDVLELHLCSSDEEKEEKRGKYIDKYSDIVIWDYARFYNLEKFIGTKPEGVFKNVIVSTNGDYVIFDEITNRIWTYTNTPNKNSKRYRSLRLEKGKWLYKLHRIIACTFIPVPKGISIRKLISNHKDLDKWNNTVTNLEWVTAIGNVQHAIRLRDELGLSSIPYLFEIIYGELKGQKFVLTRQEMSRLGIDPRIIDYCVTGQGKYTLGCSVKRIENEEMANYSAGLNKEQLEFITKNYKNYPRSNITPIIGEVLVGKYKGLKFSLFGYSETEKYFNQSSIRSHIKNQTESYRGCKFRYDTIEIALPYRFKMTKKISDYLKGGVKN